MPENQSNFPFRILGIADDGQAYFINRHERLIHTSLLHLSNDFIQNLAPLEFWKTHKSPKLTREDWLEIKDEIIQFSGMVDFDLDNIRGRGAWREPDGRLSYSDGQEIYGDYDKQRVYVKKSKRDIGINYRKATKSECQEIGLLVQSLSFKTKLDAVRCLAWAVLSPYGGALPWRSSILLTGDSGSGKTTIVDHVIHKIAMSTDYNGGQCSIPGIRNDMAGDSTPILIEEAENNSPEMRKFRDELIGLITQTSSDNAPIAVKATRDGGVVRYSMKNMFCLIAISPEIERVAGENRIFRINLDINKKESDTRDWNEVEKELENTITYERCLAIRSLTWEKLPKILDSAKILRKIIQDITGHDTRSSYADALLFSAYFLVWRGEAEINTGEAIDVIKEILSKTEVEQKRDETDEILQRILAEPIYLAESHKTMSMFEVLTEINKSFSAGITEYKRAAGIYGIAVLESGQIAMQNYNHKISEIIDRARGYDKLFKRHKKYKMSKNCNIPGIGTHNCMIFDIEFGEKTGQAAPIIPEDLDF